MPPFAGVLDQLSAQEDTLEIRRSDVMAQRRGVDVAELGKGEARRRERKAEVRVRELRAEAVARAEEDRFVVVRELGEVVDGMPASVCRDLRVDAGGHESEIRRCELSSCGVP